MAQGENKQKDELSKLIPSPRTGLKAVNQALKSVPVLRVLTPDYYKEVYNLTKRTTKALIAPGNPISNVAKATSDGMKKRNELVYGSFRFSAKDVLTKDNQPSIFKDILREENTKGVSLKQDATMMGIINTIESNKSINNCVFPLTLSKESDARTSIELLPKSSWDKHNRIGINLSENDPKAAEAAIRIAYEVAQSNTQPSGLNLDTWSNADRTIERDPDNIYKYYISSRTQQQNVEQQGQSTNDNDQITSLPRAEESSLQGKGPLRQREEFPTELPRRPEKSQSKISRLTRAMKGLTLSRDGSYTKVDSRPTSRDGH